MEAEARCRATGNGVGGRSAMHVKHGECGQPGRPERRVQEGGRERELKTEQCTHHEHRSQAQTVSDHHDGVARPQFFFEISKKNAQQCPQLARLLG